MEISINKIKTVSKYSFFSLLFAFNLFNLYFFWLRAWRTKDVMGYKDANYKGYLDVVEMFVGYNSGWSILFIFSLIYAMVYIKNKPLLAFMWLFLPVIYFVIFCCYQYHS